MGTGSRARHPLIGQLQLALLGMVLAAALAPASARRHRGFWRHHQMRIPYTTQQPSFKWDPECVKQPLGFGMFTTGAGRDGSAEVVMPQTKEELEEALCAKDKRSGGPFIHPVTNMTFKYLCQDDTPRVIVINKEFEFRGEDLTVRGCFPAEGQMTVAVDAATYCSHKPKFQVTMDAASREPLIIGSNKTITGGGTLSGKGIALRNVSNIIIRNITINDLNPFVLWSGGAITLDGVNNVWIHNVTFKRVSQEAISTYPADNLGVTISSCFFDGRSRARDPVSKQYMWLSIGGQNSISVINNYALRVAGRAPFQGKCHMKDCKAPSTVLQLVGNYFESVQSNFQHIPPDSIVLQTNTHVKNVTEDTSETSWTGGYLFSVSPNQKVMRACKDDKTSCITTAQLQSKSFLKTLSPDISTGLVRVLTSLDTIVTTAQFLTC